MSYLLQHLIASPPLVEATAGEASRRPLPGVSKVRGACLNLAQTNLNDAVAMKVGPMQHMSSDTV